MPNCASDVPVSPLSLLICGTLAAFRQKLHLSTCPNLASQLSDLALIVSHALPKGLEHFDHIEGVWVTNPRCAVPVAIALRQTLIELSAARIMSEGQQTKMEIVYQYLTGPRFRHRVEAIVERFS